MVYIMIHRTKRIKRTTKSSVRKPKTKYAKRKKTKYTKRKKTKYTKRKKTRRRNVIMRGGVDALDELLKDARLSQYLDRIKKENIISPDDVKDLNSVTATNMGMTVTDYNRLQRLAAASAADAGADAGAAAGTLKAEPEGEPPTPSGDMGTDEPLLEDVAAPPQASTVTPLAESPVGVADPQQKTAVFMRPPGAVGTKFLVADAEGTTHYASIPEGCEVGKPCNVLVPPEYKSTRTGLTDRLSMGVDPNLKKGLVALSGMLKSGKDMAKGVSDSVTLTRFQEYMSYLNGSVSSNAPPFRKTFSGTVEGIRKLLKGDKHGEQINDILRNNRKAVQAIKIFAAGLSSVP
jgi:hypothetical protein